MNASQWKPIEELPNELTRQDNVELDSLKSIWLEQSKKLKNAESLRVFNEKFKREWAIETGIIENLYSLDRGITQLLIEHGIDSALIPHGTIDKPVSLVVSIIKDQEATLDFLFDHIKGNRDLTVGFVKEIHHFLTNNQDNTDAIDSFGNYIKIPLLKGDWKKNPNNPKRTNGTMHYYAPPEQVSSEMDRLVEMHKIHQELRISTEIKAAWLHHRFTQIHPFQDGNGRVARCLASLVFIKDNWFPLIINRDNRSDYILACEKADAGDLTYLTNLFARVQKQSFLKALSLSDHVLTEDPKSSIIDSAIFKLKERNEIEQKEHQAVFNHAIQMEDVLLQKINEIELHLKTKLKSINNEYYASHDKSDLSNHHWFRKQIIQIAKQFDYYADTRTYAKWFRLKIIEDRNVEIVFCIHSLGTSFLGILVITSFIEYRDRDDQLTTSTSIDGPYPICKEIFQFSYNEEISNVVKRFSIWLDQCIVAGLDQWRRQL